MRRIFAIVIFVAAAAVAGAEDGTAGPSFHFPTPEGWRTETIPFPLDFAPGLDYEGVEELRFAPGMFSKDAEDFWSYAFVWWIAIDSEISPDRFAMDLEAYFSGLADAVAPGKGFDLSQATYDVEFEKSTAETGGVLQGRAAIFEPFVTGTSVVLNIRVTEIACAAVGHRAVIFEISPQPFSHPVWGTLELIREGTRCGG